jgi:AhpD family alkylhydroperoxidase
VDCGKLEGQIMSTVKLVDESSRDPIVEEVFRDIKETKKIHFVPNFWRTLATNPPLLRQVWNQLKTTMRPGKIDLQTKEIIALAVSATNGCAYCINSHTAALVKLGLDAEALGEVMAVVGLFNMTNKLADGYQVEPDIVPKWEGR